MRRKRKLWKCRLCNDAMEDGEILKAPSPFNKTDILHGCPTCGEANSFVLLCDEDDCTNEAECGTPTPNGYRQTCGRHTPARDEHGKEV